MRLHHVHAGDFRLDEAASPEESKGQFEGFRIVFFVLIPWIVSPFIANPIIKNNGQILDSNGFAAYLPAHVLFLISTLLVLATFVPLFFAARQRRARDERSRYVDLVHDRGMLLLAVFALSGADCGKVSLRWS